MVVPALLLQFHLHGTLGSAEQSEEKAGADVHRFSGFERRLIFFFGVGGLLFVPIFHSLTHLPPLYGHPLGARLALDAHGSALSHEKTPRQHDQTARGDDLAQDRHDYDYLLLGILLAVATLKETGVLPAFGQWPTEIRTDIEAPRERTDRHIL